MVCTIVNWDNTNAVRQQQRRKGRHNTSSSASSIRGPTLFFNTRTHAGHTLEACCSLQSVSSYDSSIMEPSVSGEEGNEHNATTTATTKEEAKKDAHIHTTTTTTPIAEMMQAQQQLHRIKKSFSVPCSCIKTVEKMSYLLFRGYRICFITGSRGAFELEFENKNGRDIMMAFLQATLPGERFVHCGSGSTAERSVDGSDTASYLSALDLEKLTERLAAERQYNETMSEKLRNGVGKVVSRMEESECIYVMYCVCALYCIVWSLYYLCFVYCVCSNSYQYQSNQFLSSSNLNFTQQYPLSTTPTNHSVIFYLWKYVL